MFSKYLKITILDFDGFLEESDSFYNVKLITSTFLILKAPSLKSTALKVHWKWFWEDKEVNYLKTLNGNIIF